MTNTNRLEATIPTQRTSSAKDRLIIDRDGVKQQIHILTCQTTAAHYCLYFTGRIGLEGMAESIDHAVDRMLAYTGRCYKTGDVQVIGSSDLGRWLVEDKFVPFFSLLKENGEKPKDWRVQLSTWLREGGTALVAYGFHARALVEDEHEGNFIQIDPSTASKIAIDLATLPEEAFYQCMLVPPKPEDATVGMVRILQWRMRLLRPLVGDNRMLDYIVPAASWNTPASLQLVEKDYISKPGVIKIKPYQVREKGLPKIISIDLDKDGMKDVAIESPGEPSRKVNLPPQVLIVSPESHEIIEIRKKDLLSPPEPIVVEPSSPKLIEIKKEDLKASPQTIRVRADKR